MRANTSANDSPLVSAVAMRLTTLITEGALPAGHTLPSERDLAKAFSASRGVVRAAVQQVANQGLINAKPRCRPVVQPLKAKAEPVARSTKRHIGIWLWPNTGEYSAASILKGIQSTDLGSSVRLIVASAAAGDWESVCQSESRFLQSILDDPDDAGVILWYLGRQRNLDVLQKLRDASVPMVFLDRLPPMGFEADMVGTDNFAAARKAVQHLTDLGHRRIALLTNIDTVSSVQGREEGYRRALKDACIEVREDLILRDWVDDPEGVEAALDACLRLDEPPTAIFCINDHMALQVYEALLDRKISVPGQISIVGFDGLLRWVPGGGYLTTAMQDFERMGQLAAELVIERIGSEPPESYRHVLLDAPLIDRGSTAPLSHSDPSFDSRIRS